MAYDKHYWNINEPITQANMNRIEDGIANADATANNAVSSITNLSNVIGTGFSTTNTVTTQVSNLQSQINSNRIDNIQEIQNATAEVMAAHKETTTSTSNKYTNLLARFMELDDKIGETEGKADTANNAIDNARIPENGPSYSSLRSRLNGIDTTISTINTQISNINDEIDIARQGENSLDDRLDYMTTTSNDIDHRLEILATEISDARKAKDNIERSSLTARLVDIINDSEAYTNTTISTATGVLGSQASSGEPHTVKTYVDEKTAEITNAHRALNDTLDNRFDDIESAISHAASGSDAGGLTERVTALESSSASTSALSELSSQVSTLNTTVSGHTTSISNNTSAISALQSAVSHTKDENDDNDLGGLEQRMTGAESRLTTLESSSGGSATIVISNPTYSNGDPVVDSPNAGIDYLIKGEGNDDQYYYWKYINNKWELISGGSGGGTGTSSGKIVTDLNAITEPDENTDYFVGNNNDGYTHYRYQNNTFIKILPTTLIDNVGVQSITLNPSAVVDTDEWPDTTTSFSGGLKAYAISDTTHETNLLEDFVAVRNARVNAVYDGDNLQSQTLQVLDTKGNLIEYPIVGGSGGNAYSIRLVSTLSNNTFTVPSSDDYRTTVSARATVKQGNTLLNDVSFTGSISYRLSTSNTWISSSIVVPAISNNTEFTVDVSSILATNRTTIVRLMLSINTGDGEPVSRYLDYTITKTQISISSTFDPSSIVTTNNLIVPYTCQGVGLQKTVYFKIDGEDAIQPITTYNHNETAEIAIPLTEYEYGAHRLQIYFMADSIPSNKLNYYFIYNLDASSNTPIVGLISVKEEITYGEELVVNYTAYTPGKETTDKVEIKLYTLGNNDEHIIYKDKVDVRTNVRAIADSWKTTAYPQPITPQQGQPEQPITAYIEITAYHYVTTENNGVTSTTTYSDTHYTQVIINRFTNPNNYDFSEIDSRNVLYSYNAYGKTNTDNNRDNYEYVYTANDGNDTEVTFHGGFTRFNWATDGYVDGSSLTISGGAQHTIDVPIFSTTYNGIPLDAQTANDITKYGRTIEIDYEVRSATDLNATIIECMDPKTHVGLRVTPNYCYLTNQTTAAQVDTKDSFILNESSIAAAYLQTNTRMHLVFVIEPWSQEKAFDKTYHQCVDIYINGEYANSCAYERDGDGNLIDSFTTDATLTFGSDTCILKLYSVKLYNRGLTQKQVLQAYRMAPTLLYDRLTRFADNDVLDDSGYVSYEKAKKRYNCLLLKGPDPTAQATLDWPTISPFKGSKSPAKRKKKETDVEYEGKTESGLIFTKPSSDPNTPGYIEEFNLCDKVPAGAPAYLGAAGAYCSSNNVQGTSSQKYPLHNLKVYLAKWQKEKTETAEVALQPGEEVPEGVETIEKDGITYKIVTTVTPAQIKKFKYCLKGKDDQGNNLGTEESTFCWKADYMSTDHANTYNANIADGLFSDKLLPDWDSKKYQNTVYGIRCLLFQQQGDDADPVFVGDGTLNNDKGNTKTFGLEYENKTNPELSDNGVDTLRQKWEFTNNTFPLNTFKSDNLFGINEKDSDRKIYAKNAFECSYPDEGDLKDEGLEPNYNHLQVLLTWVNKRACYLDYSVYDEDTDQTTNYTISDTAGTGGTYNGVTYSTERELKKAIFKNEFEQHFNLNHVLTYYIFSEYIALCDNRAKNMFLRSEDIRSEVIRNDQGQIILNGNEYPDDGTLWNQYVNTTTGVTNPSKVDWLSGAGHSTFAKWAPVLYDLDSCFGLENVGLITIKYNADWQYKYNDKEAFSGFDSIFWLMVEDTYADEIRALAKSLYNNDLNFSNFYRQQITGNKNATCPALVNQDMILKYDVPWNEGFINYAEDPDPVTGLREPETPLYKYIQRGTRSTQKATFMRQRSMLLSSKYVSNEFTNSMISFRAGVQVTGNDTLLQLVANQDLYPAIMFGDSNVLIRATHIIQNDQSIKINGNTYMVPAGTPCQITTSQINNSDTVKIVGASVLTDIGDISKYQPYELKVGSGTNLKRLIIGSNAAGYINTSTESIEGLSDCAILEELNVRNLTKLTTLNLGGNGLIKKVYAGGSGITTISLPNGGVVREIEYSANTTNITLLNQRFFTTFNYENAEINNYNNVTRLWIENTPHVPIVDIVAKRLPNLTNGVRLIGIDLSIDETLTESEQKALSDAYVNFIDRILTPEYAQGKYLSDTGTRDSTRYPEITGTIDVLTIRESLVTRCANIYPNLTINVLVETLPEFPIQYMNVDANGNRTLLLTLYRMGTQSILDPITDQNELTGNYYIQEAPSSQIAYDGTQWVPIREADAQYYYRFGTYNASGKYTQYSGWEIDGNTGANIASTTISGPMTLLAKYPVQSNIVRTYTVTWYDYDGRTVLNSISNVAYGTDGSNLSAPSKNDTIAPLVTKKEVNGSYKVFTGWDKPLTKITGDMNIYSQWETFNTTISTSEGITDLNTLNAAAWYYITRLNASARETLLEDHLGTSLFNIQLGHDFNYDDYITTYDLLEGLEDGETEMYFSGENTSEARIYDGTSAHESQSIYPLADLSQDFTLALDFKFLLDNTQWNKNTGEHVIASCFQSSGTSINGFRVTLQHDSTTTPSIQVLWGTSAVTIDYASVGTNSYDSSTASYSTYRNMIVLRHRGDEPNALYVYYAPPSSNPAYYNNNPITYTRLTWSSSTAVTNPLVLGGNLSGSTSNIESSTTRVNAKGIIYYAKYWAADIGNGNCVDLAAWPHETVAYKIMGYVNSAQESDSAYRLGIKNNDGTIRINFTPAQVIGDRKYNFSSTGTAAFNDVNINSLYYTGWGSSLLRDFCNSRIYNALPVSFQSLLEPAHITSVGLLTNTNSNTSGTNASTISTTTYETEDYIYIPSFRELEPNITDSALRREAIQVWPWMDTGNINNVYTLSSTAALQKESNISILNYLRLQFFHRPIKPTAKIFHMSSAYNPGSNTWYYTNVSEGISNQPITAQYGDIWYIDSNQAYIFVSLDELERGSYEVDPVMTTARGGWVPATIWASRTFYTSLSRWGQLRYFYHITGDGTIQVESNNAYIARALVPEFSI